MKIPTKQIETFVNGPAPNARVILVYGPDRGLMKKRSKIIGKTISPDLNDPFNVTTFSSTKLLEDISVLNDEANTMSMMGGKRLILVENALDKITNIIKDYLQNPNPENLVILEAGELGPKSTLRKIIEKSEKSAAIPCYVEDAGTLSKTIYKKLQKHSMTIDTEALNYLTSCLTGDRQKMVSGVEKLITYMGEENQKITINDVQACCGEAGEKSLENLIYSVAGSQPKTSMETYSQLLQEGMPVIAILRALQSHFQKLHYTKALIAKGENIEQIMKKLTPPIFFKQTSAFKAQTQHWSLPAIEKILLRLTEIEKQCKQTGSPTEALCGQALLAISKK